MARLASVVDLPSAGSELVTIDDLARLVDVDELQVGPQLPERLRPRRLRVFVDGERSFRGLRVERDEAQVRRVRQLPQVVGRGDGRVGRVAAQRAGDAEHQSGEQAEPEREGQTGRRGILRDGRGLDDAHRDGRLGAGGDRPLELVDERAEHLADCVGDVGGPLRGRGR